MADEKPKKVNEAPKGKQKEAKEERRNLVRLLKKDLPADIPIERSLRGMSGISYSMARAIRIKSGLSPETKLSDLNETELKDLEKMLEDIPSLNIPTWLLNRRKDFATGIDNHLLESDLMFSVREDVSRMKKIRSYRGIRHMFGLKVRGQRTRSTGRKNRTVGVRKKKKGAAAQPAQPKPSGGKK